MLWYERLSNGRSALCAVSLSKMEDGQTLFDYNVGLNDIVQLLIRSHADPPDSPTPKDYEVAACSSASPAAVTPASNGAKSSSQSLDNQPSTSNRSSLIHPGIGAFKVSACLSFLPLISVAVRIEYRSNLEHFVLNSQAERRVSVWFCG
uniref:Ubiquitin-like domain-containing protein n=1 Tax=Paramormyrops kingsleyae TaxID=1676925 RepID=A0A3B3RLV7_9TELE